VERAKWEIPTVQSRAVGFFVLGQLDVDFLYGKAMETLKKTQKKVGHSSNGSEENIRNMTNN